MRAPAVAAGDTALAGRLRAIVGERRVLVRDGELRAYESDGLPGYQQRPSIAVFPGTREETIAVVRVLAELAVPFVPRGAGTGLSGGSLADGVVLLGLHRLNRVLSIDHAPPHASTELLPAIVAGASICVPVISLRTADADCCAWRRRSARLRRSAG